VNFCTPLTPPCMPPSRPDATAPLSTGGRSDRFERHSPFVG
jgi:hypothetical protein